MGDDKATAAAKTGISDILVDSTTKLVSFSLQGISVGPTGFADVSKAVRDGKIKVKLLSADDAKGFAALYDAKGNTFLIGPAAASLSGAPVKSLIVHESVHAIIDMNKMKKPVTQLVGEAVAYVAQSIYYWTAKDPTRQKKFRQVSKNRIVDNIFLAGALLADAVLAGTDITQAYADLTAAILAYPDYQKADKIEHRSDGVF